MAKRTIKPRTELVVCACGCGETFEAVIRTRPILYKNKTHQMRAYRRHKREAEQETDDHA